VSMTVPVRRPMISRLRDRPSTASAWPRRARAPS